jgi:hypothetical protein
MTDSNKSPWEDRIKDIFKQLNQKSVFKVDLDENRESRVVWSVVSGAVYTALAITTMPANISFALLFIALLINALMVMLSTYGSIVILEEIFMSYRKSAFERANKKAFSDILVQP